MAVGVRLSDKPATTSLLATDLVPLARATENGKLYTMAYSNMLARLNLDLTRETPTPSVADNGKVLSVGGSGTYQLVSPPTPNSFNVAHLTTAGVNQITTAAHGAAEAIHAEPGANGIAFTASNITSEAEWLLVNFSGAPITPVASGWTGVTNNADGSSALPTMDNGRMAIVHVVISGVNKYLNMALLGESTATQVRLDNVSQIPLLPAPAVVANRAIFIEVASYHPAWQGISAGPAGGGVFVWDPNKAKSSHNGGTIISPTVPWDGTQATLAAFLSGTGETQPSGNGCWIRILTTYTSVLDFGAKGDNSVNDAAAIQRACDYLSTNGGTLFFPRGVYKISSPINWPSRVNLLGVGGHVGSRIVGTHSGNLFQYTNIDFCIVEKMAFDGSACTAFKQTGVAANYTQNVTWQNCHFYGQLSECISGNLIFAKIFSNTFGYYGTVGASHRHIVSLGSSTNLTNSNQIKRNRFYFAKGNESIRFDSGSGLSLAENNFEQNTALPLRLNGMFNVSVDHNWFEANSIATSEIEINTGTNVIDSTPITIRRNNFVPASSVTNIIRINNALTKVYFDENTGNLTGKSISNDATKIRSQLGNSFTGLVPPEYVTQETGTFTLTDGSGAGLTLIGGNGTYSRNGKVITFVVNFSYPVTADVSNAKLTGLPYAVSALTPFISADNSGAALTFIADATATTAVPYLVGALTPRTNANLSGKQFYMAGSYLI